jgi:alpha-ketoglutarate-dependent taurine dioxygenase
MTDVRDRPVGPLTVRPLDACFGAVITEVDLRELDDVAVGAIKTAWLEHGLLVFPGQFFERGEQDTFARRFGDLEFTAAPISNLDKDGNVHSTADDEIVKSLRGNEGWHHDSTYMPIQAKGAVFSAEIIPSAGADTGFADMRAAYNALNPAMLDRIKDMCAYHSLYYSQGRAGLLPSQRNDDGTYAQYGYHDLTTPLRPLVKVHPDTGRANLVIGRHAHDIVGLDPEESEALLDELNAYATQPQWTYHHRWSVGDAILWDNRRLMHRATPYDMTQRRRMWHTRIAGDATTELAINHR